MIGARVAAGKMSTLCFAGEKQRRSALCLLNHQVQKTKNKKVGNPEIMIICNVISMLQIWLDNWSDIFKGVISEGHRIVRIFSVKVTRSVGCFMNVIPEV